MERLGLGGREMTASGHSKDFVLKVVQPSLVGLMDGSVSTLAPLFATAFATRDPRIAFLVGLAAAVVGIELLAISFIRYRYFSMSFAMSALQVILGGALVFAAGILIGSA